MSICPSRLSSSGSNSNIRPSSVVRAFVEALGALSTSISTFSYGSRYLTTPVGIFCCTALVLKFQLSTTELKLGPKT